MNVELSCIKSRRYYADPIISVLLICFNGRPPPQVCVFVFGDRDVWRGEKEDMMALCGRGTEHQALNPCSNPVDCVLWETSEALQS